MTRLLPTHPYPPPVALDLPDGVTVVPAVPGSSGAVLAFGKRPDWFCDVAVVPTPEGLPTALAVVLSGQPDPRIHTGTQWMYEQFGYTPYVDPDAPRIPTLA